MNFFIIDMTHYKTASNTCKHKW